MGLGVSKEVYDQVESASCAAFQPPRSLTLYRNNRWAKRSFSLGTDRSGPLYHVSVKHGDIILHGGPTPESPPLAAAYGYRSIAALVIPPLEPGQPGFQSEFAVSAWTEGAYSFQVPVFVAGAWRVHRFEWRRSGGDDVASLGQSWRGWKLVRADSPTQTEVLAVWSESWLSVSRAAEFQFRNAGATGALGDAFALMTMLSFVKLLLALLQRRERKKGG